jgi:predicted nucleic acid-binding protein
MTKGHRTMDILHVATALHTAAGKFISFDENQRKLAMAEGLKLAQATQKI